jgi:CRISPR-associated protein Cmr6
MNSKLKSTRRKVLAEVEAAITTNPGLWRDKYIANQGSEDNQSKRNLVNEVAHLVAPQEMYKPFYDRWRKSLESYEAQCREARVKGRMVVGLGSESVLETSITLHHTYGVPHIPGTALKGLASSYAHQRLTEEWKNGGPAHKTAFGNQEEAGYVTFFDALYIPGSAHNGQALYPDVLSVHHQLYYQDKTGAPPADWDEPIPVSFLAATGSYLIALAGPPAWVETVFAILKLALAEYGVGAKTSSGYGRLELMSAPARPVDPDRQKADELIRRIEAISINKVPGEIPQQAQDWKALQISEAEKRRVAKAIIDKVREAGRTKASADKSWYKELLASLE